jgi:hypothetical protein
MSVNNNPTPKMYTGNIDDDDDPYGSNFNPRFYVDME